MAKFDFSDLHPSIQPLSQAIDAIPMESERERMLAAVQHNLCLLQYTISTNLPRAEFPITEYGKLGFTNELVHEQWITDIVKAYRQALDDLPMGYDIFGELHALHFNRGNARLAQHFTTNALARAAFKFSNAHDEVEPETVKKIADPTCGSGAMILAALSKEQPVEILINDIDPLCTATACLQILANFAHKKANVVQLTAWNSDVIAEYLTKDPVLAFVYHRD